MRCSSLLPALALLAILADLPCQTGPGHALVATEMSGGTTQLLDVDLDTGVVANFGSFPSELHAPLAVEIDPVNRNIILALEDGASSRVLRLAAHGHDIAEERLLAFVPGRVTDLFVDPNGGSIFASVDGDQGGIYRLPRNGGPAEEKVKIPRASALGEFAWVAESGTSGPGGNDPRFRALDFQTGDARRGPVTLTGFPTAGLTGMVEIPSAIGWVLITADDGSLTRASEFAPQVPLELSPPLPPGGAVAVELENVTRAIVLGGQAHPFLKTVEPYGNPPVTWALLAGPLPGNPVDFDLEEAGMARLVNYGRMCSAKDNPGLFNHHLGGPPTVGNKDFALILHGAAADSPAFLVLGVSDQSWLGTPLPIALLVDGCELLVSVELVLRKDTDSRGESRLPVPIPNLPALNGASFFAQWLIIDHASLETSAAAAVQIFDR